MTDVKKYWKQVAIVLIVVSVGVTIKLITLRSDRQSSDEDQGQIAVDPALLQSEGKYSEAATGYESLAYSSENTDTPLYLEAAGDAYERSGDNLKAIEVYEKAAESFRSKDMDTEVSRIDSKIAALKVRMGITGEEI